MRAQCGPQPQPQLGHVDTLVHQAAGMLWQATWRWVADGSCRTSAALRTAARRQACTYCGDPAITMDHLLPIMSGGMPTGVTGHAANRVPSCGTCNASKGARHWREFMTCATGSAPLARLGRGPGATRAHAARMAALAAQEKRAQTVSSRQLASSKTLEALRADLLRTMQAHAAQVAALVAKQRPAAGGATGKSVKTLRRLLRPRTAQMGGGGGPAARTRSRSRHGASARLALL
jgi:hypothetical protein